MPMFSWENWRRLCLHVSHWTITLEEIYIDDCFCIWTATKQSLDQFITYLNGCDPHIKFTWQLTSSQSSRHQSLLSTTSYKLNCTTNLHSHNYRSQPALHSLMITTGRRPHFKPTHWPTSNISRTFEQTRCQICPHLNKPNHWTCTATGVGILDKTHEL